MSRFVQVVCFGGFTVRKQHSFGLEKNVHTHVVSENLNYCWFYKYSVYNIKTKLKLLWTEESTVCFDCQWQSGGKST